MRACIAANARVMDGGNDGSAMSVAAVVAGDVVDTVGSGAAALFAATRSTFALCPAPTATIGEGLFVPSLLAISL
jgi:hypothetical protein